MMRKKSPDKRRLGWKIMILICGIVLLAGLIFFQQSRRVKEKKEREGADGEEEIQMQVKLPEGAEIKKKSAEEGTGILLGDVEKTDEESTAAEGNKSAEVHITNLEEYAAEVMGEHMYLLEQSLADWVKEKQLCAETAAIFFVRVPESDPQSINYYIRIEDGKGSLVMLSYHPRENVVTASICNYTEEEIKAEVWEDNGPCQRDVSAEEEAEFLEGQEVTDETGGED